MPIVKKISLYIFYFLLGYMPLHIFLSTWLGTSFGALEVTRVAKDVLLLAGFGLAVVSMGPRAVKAVWNDKLTWLILAYGGLTLLLALVRPTDGEAELLGLVYNTRFLVFFLYAGLLIKNYGIRITETALKIVLLAGAVVALFGIFQYSVLSNTALEHVGYTRSNGVLPAFFIDDKPDLERVMSTVRDPNSLGSYLLIIGSLAGAMLVASSDRRRMFFGGVLLASGTCLLLTFSRSAWLGAGVSTVTILALLPTSSRLIRTHSKKFIISGVTLLCVVGGGLLLARDSYFVKNVVFHADDATVLEDPNELRVRFWQESVQDILRDPLGSGPGTAGLVSIRNNVQGTELNENYYLQIASEVGVIGLVLFVGILAMTAMRLYAKIRQNLVAAGLLGAFAGLLVTNFLVHIWSNEAVAYTWWGLAGLVVYLPPTKTKSKTST